MSLITKITEAVTPERPPLFAAPGIERQLKAAEGKLGELEATHGNLALEAVSGVQGAQERLADHEADILAARRSVSTLRAAHAAAIQKDEMERRRQVAALQATQVRAMTSHLRARDRAAEELSTALATACEAFRELVQRSAKAVAACPVQTKWPAGSLCDFGELKRLVEQELFRLGGDPTIGNRQSFPGGAPHDLSKTNHPEAMTPIADALKQATEHTLAFVKGQVAE